MIGPGKRLSKFMVPITLFEKFSCLTFITSIKVNYMHTHSSKSYKLKNINFIRGTTWNVVIQKEKIYYIKIKVIAFIINFGGIRYIVDENPNMGHRYRKY